MRGGKSRRNGRFRRGSSLRPERMRRGAKDFYFIIRALSFFSKNTFVQGQIAQVHIRLHKQHTLSLPLSICLSSVFYCLCYVGCRSPFLYAYLSGFLPVGGLNHMMLGCRDDARFPAQTADKHVRAHGFTEVCCDCADSHHNPGTP